jgi:gamma-butyrobetaine dioxygenase
MHAHQLCKGEAVVFDNRRVLHGRTAFGLRRFESMGDHREAGGGLRWCYFEGDTMASHDKILYDRVARGERGVI